MDKCFVSEWISMVVLEIVERDLQAALKL